MKKILLIEDNPEIMRINTMMLRMRKYDVLQAFSLTEASERMAEKPPDMIVMETVLPDGNGLDFCRDVKEKSKIPILFLSGLSEGDDVVAGLRAGADDYMTKPHDIGILLARIEARLRSDCCISCSRKGNTVLKGEPL